MEGAIESGGDIYIAEGTYTPVSTINLSVNVTHLVQGGFPASATGTDTSTYDPALYPTIIDGQGSIQLFDNSSRVDNIHLKGLTFQGGNSTNGSVFSSTFNSSNPIDFKFTDLILTNNNASRDGTIFISTKTVPDTKISFLNCNFNNNSADNGGGIYVEAVYNQVNGSIAVPGNLVIDNCRFEDNTATGNFGGGGAIYFGISNAWIINNTDFCGNNCLNARGGALYTNDSGNNELDNCFFSDNSTGYFGGAIYSTHATGTIANTIFADNEVALSGGGGAISSTNSTWHLDYTGFYNNTATLGGAVYSGSWKNNVRSTASNCIFFGNTASGSGTTSGTDGGGALCIGSNVNPNGWDIDSCAFVNNTVTAASWGGAISHGETEMSITNSLFYNNTKGGNANISGSDIKNLDNTGGFSTMSGNQMQLASAAAYTNQNGATDASSYTFTNDTFANTDDGSLPQAPASPCLSEFNITGTVFEDINYGGGLGRDFTTADNEATAWSPGAIGIENVVVELYDFNGVYLKDTITNTDGVYTFPNLTNGTYLVRVANHTIISNRASNGTGGTIVPVQTFRTDGTNDVINELGGTDPTLIDGIVNPGGQNISSLADNITTTIQSFTSITIADDHSPGVDFGFNFSTIVNTNDSGQGSLRQFILNSNELDNTNLDQEDFPSGGSPLEKPAGWEVSIFSIPVSGVQVILPDTELPPILEPRTHITGYTQFGAGLGDIQSRTINIELFGNGAAFDGLELQADSLQVSGLSVHGFNSGIFSSLSGMTDVFIWGNYLGMEADGITPSSISNSGVHFFETMNSFIGTNGDNVYDAIEGNLISNSNYGIQLETTDNVLIAGNYVGTDKTGMINQSNTNGIIAASITAQNYIGFKDDMPNGNVNDFRNIISGNGTNEIRLNAVSNLTIAGNYIGVNESGTGVIEMSSAGIQFINLCENNVVGTNANGLFDELERNIIVASTGIRLTSSGTGNDNTIAGNYIGTDPTGMTSLSGTLGIQILGSFANLTIGTNGDGIWDENELNVISGHLEDGIRMNSANTGNTIIAGNLIGVAADGISPLGNQERGIFIRNPTSNAVIGWSPSMSNTDELVVGNKIKHNGDAGIGLTGIGTVTISNNRISRNQIADNGGLGISFANGLGNFSVTPNDDGDTDTGENDLLNFPVLDTVYLDGNDLIARGFAPVGSTVEFYIADTGPNPNPLPAGYTSNFGEGAVFIASATEGGFNDLDFTTVTYTDDGTGSTTTKTESRFHFIIDVTGIDLPANASITALTIDEVNNTSEFGNIESLAASVEEICHNGIDDDGDGDIDCADGDCAVYDTDGDSICNSEDLDDDNDGIPDTDEGCLTNSILIWNGITPAFVNVSGGTPAADQPVSYTNSEGTFEYTIQVDNPDDNSFNQISIGTYQVLGINAAGLDSLSDFVELSIDIDNVTPGIILQEVSFTIDDIDRGGDVNTREVVRVVGYNGTTAVSPYVTAQQSGFLVISPPASDQSVSTTTTTNDNLPFLPGDSNAAGTAEQAAIDVVFKEPIDRFVITYSQTGVVSNGGLGLRTIFGSYCSDTDSDGIANSMDLDADNDGIFDLDEAGHGQVDADTDGIIDGSASTFGSNGLFDGVETVADNGILNYTISDSEATPDNIYDAYELDADEDTCFDALEQGVADGDSDGIAGTGTPVVDANGLVISNTYVSPSDNDWQNPSISVCAPSCDAQAPVLSKN